MWCLQGTDTCLSQGEITTLVVVGVVFSVILGIILAVILLRRLFGQSAENEVYKSEKPVESVEEKKEKAMRKASLGQNLLTKGPFSAVSTVDYIDEDGNVSGTLIVTLPLGIEIADITEENGNNSIGVFFVKYRKGTELGVYRINPDDFSIDEDEYDFNWNWQGTLVKVATTAT